MSCPCNKCNGIISEYEFNGFWGFDATQTEAQEEKPVSIWERLAKVSNELKDYGAPAHFINELNDICDQIDSIDSEVLKVQELLPKRPIDLTQFQLGEISKKLY